MRRNLEPMLSAADIAHMLGVTAGVIVRLRERGEFPTPDCVVGARCERWRRRTVSNWVKTRRPRL